MYARVIFHKLRVACEKINCVFRVLVLGGIIVALVSYWLVELNGSQRVDLTCKLLELSYLS